MKKIRFKKPKNKHEKFTPLVPNGVDERPDFYLHSVARIRRAEAVVKEIIQPTV